MSNFQLVILALPLILQGLIISVDEFISHRRRKVSLVEQGSHIVDSVLFLLAFSLPTFLEMTSTHVGIFVLLATISCVSITKDEWIHSREADGFEMWLHSLLFLLHPLTLISGYLLWPIARQGQFPLIIHWGLVFSFTTYQIVRLAYEAGQRRERPTNHQQSIL